MEIPIDFLILIVSVGFHHVGATLPVVMSLLVGLGIAGMHRVKYLEQWRGARTANQG